MAQHAVAGRGQTEPPSVTMEQGRLHQVLQALHLQAERGLGHEHPFRRPQHGSRIHDRRETAQQFRGQVHHHCSSHMSGAHKPVLQKSIA